MSYHLGSMFFKWLNDHIWYMVIFEIAMNIHWFFGRIHSGNPWSSDVTMIISTVSLAPDWISSLMKMHEQLIFTWLLGLSSVEFGSVVWDCHHFFGWNMLCASMFNHFILERWLWKVVHGKETMGFSFLCSICVGSDGLGSK
jgi:hypothetical protein